MGYYEVTYFYHKRLPDGKWDMAERHEMKKKVGGPDKPVELDELAGVILSQLAKRDKLVADVQIHEYVRQEISFRETKDGQGILLRNRRFVSDSVAGQVLEEENDEEPSRSQVRNGDLKPVPSREGKTSNEPEAIRGWMVFDPEIPLLHEARQKGLKMSVGKRYPVYRIESTQALGSILTVRDDSGRMVTVSDKYFVANTRVRLVGDDEVEGGFSSPPRPPGQRLSYESQFDSTDMPDLRSR